MDCEEPKRGPKSVTLVNSVLTFHRLRMRAIGMNDNSETMFMVMASLYMRQLTGNFTMTPQMAVYLRAAYLKGAIEQMKRQILAMVDGAETMEQKRAIHPTVQRLSSQIQELGFQLEGLTNGDGS